MVSVFLFGVLAASAALVPFISTVSAEVARTPIAPGPDLSALNYHNLQEHKDEVKALNAKHDADMEKMNVRIATLEHDETIARGWLYALTGVGGFLGIVKSVKSYLNIGKGNRNASE